MKYFGYFFKDWGQNNTAKTFTKETETEKGMDFKRTVRFQPSETHYFSPLLQTQYCGHNTPKQQISDTTFSVVLILKDVSYRKGSRSLRSQFN